MIAPPPSFGPDDFYPLGFFHLCDGPGKLAGCSYPNGLQNWDHLFSDGYKWIVNLAEDNPVADVRPLRRLHSVELEDLCSGDSPADPAREEKLIIRAAKMIFDRIQNGEGVIVHCVGGRGRTGTVLGVVLWLLGHKAGSIVDWLNQLNHQRKGKGWPESLWQADILHEMTSAKLGFDSNHRKELCQKFFAYLIKHPRGTLRVAEPATWLPNAITASGGAGNPPGSIIRIRAAAHASLRKILLEQWSLLCGDAMPSQEIFDRLNFETCDRLISSVRTQSSETSFSFGRAQKLMGIYFKTLYAAFWGELRKIGEDENQPLEWLRCGSVLGHIPVDRQTVLHVDREDKGMRPYTRNQGNLISWKWDLEKDAYQAIQQWIRNKALMAGYMDPIHYEMDVIWPQPNE